MASNVDNAWNRHPEFWFADGSIILLAHDVLFRVHKSFLARHSLVFRDMFSIPQPSTESSSASDNSDSKGVPSDHEMIDGCPLVRIHDTPDDVASLLYALYDGPSVYNSDLLILNMVLTFTSGNSEIMGKMTSGLFLVFCDSQANMSLNP